MQNGNLPTFMQKQILKIHTVPCVNNSLLNFAPNRAVYFNCWKDAAQKHSLLDFYFYMIFKLNRIF